MSVTCGCDVASTPPAFVRDGAQDEQDSRSRLNDGGIFAVIGAGGSIVTVNPESSSESSSIGVPDDTDEEEEVEGEAESKFQNGSFGSLASLEDSLPMKRSLSSNLSGKSKSFANLSEVRSVKDIEKPENPWNKKRRTMMASKLYSRKKMPIPLLFLNSEGDDEEHEHHANGSKSQRNRKKRKKKKRRSFSLTDPRK